MSTDESAAGIAHPTVVPADGPPAATGIAHLTVVPDNYAPADDSED